jgi:phage FluMu gp28-like protein
LDEFAFVGNNLAEDFFSSVYPTISSGQTTQVIIVSTPNGMNHFYKMWTDAEEGNSKYVPIEVH